MDKDSPFIKNGAKVMLTGGGVSLGSVAIMMVVALKEDVRHADDRLGRRIDSNRKELREDVKGVTERMERILDRMEKNTDRLERMIERRSR